MYEQDYLLRLAKQLTAVIQRIAGLRKAAPEALAQAEQAYGDLFGLPPGLIDVMAPAELARLVGDPGKIAMLVQLLEVEAGLLEDTGRSDEAERKRTRAEELGYFAAARK